MGSLGLTPCPLSLVDPASPSHGMGQRSYVHDQVLRTTQQLPPQHPPSSPILPSPALCIQVVRAIVREGVQRGGLTGVNLSRCEDVSVGQPRHLVDRQRRKLHCQRKLASVHARPVLAELVLTLLRVERRRVHRLAEDLERESARLLKPDVVSVVLSEERLRCPRVGPNARRLPSRVVARRVSRVQLE